MAKVINPNGDIVEVPDDELSFFTETKGWKTPNGADSEPSDDGLTADECRKLLSDNDINFMANTGLVKLRLRVEENNLT